MTHSYILLMEVIKALNFVVLLLKCVTKWNKLGLVMVKLKSISDSVYNDLFLGFPSHKNNFFFFFSRFGNSMPHLPGYG